MIRLFVALPLPAEIRERLALMTGGIPGARWTPVDNFHLTLRFIGEVEAPDTDDIVAALGQVRAPGFALSLAGIDQFGRGEKARTLWMGVDRNPALMQLHERIESALLRAGLEPERRKFVPHVTLARLARAPSDRLGGFVQANQLVRLGPIPVDRFALFSSWLGGDAPVYEEEVEFFLTAAAS